MNYLIECSLFSILAAGLYWIFRHSMTLRERRLTLVSILIFSALIPLIHVPVGYQPLEKVSINRVMDISQATQSLGKTVIPKSISTEQGDGLLSTDKVVPLESNNDESWSYQKVAVWMYGLVVTFLLLHFIVSLWAIARLYKKSPWVSSEGLTYREVPVEGFLGAAFFRTVFIGSSLDPSRVKMVFQHEQAHSRLLHSFDILLVQIYLIFLWANPVAWILRKEIRLVTECEADQVVAKQLDVKSYSHGLLDISFSRSVSALLPAFSKHAIKYRLDQLLSKKEVRWSRLRFIIPVVMLLLLVVFACEVDRDMLYARETRTLGDVKTITTTYVSHQSDTQQKDGQIIAVASFDVNGGLVDIVEHTTYPYDNIDPNRWELWPERQSKFVPHLLDGLSLGDAQKNFLYGNDWPVRYEGLYSSRISPRIYETDKVTKSIEYLEGKFPKEIRLSVENDRMKDRHGFTRSDTYVEQFEAEGGKVTSHKLGISSIYNSGDRIEQTFNPPLNETNFAYNGDNLIRVTKGDVDYKFYYENDRLVRSEYLSGGKLYNQRIYHYNDSGLKTKTEIFNVYGEPEYTIYYDYEFWGE